MRITIDEILTVYAIGAAITHTIMTIKWLLNHTNKYIAVERQIILRHHVWNHKVSIKSCMKDNCSQL